ncbi:MAG: DUF2085 domain-containing protein [Chloroflexi bacterium]|nr:MAG: DUF2085 domain-containing protein [Chloroflexota bacterium]MBL1195531.1 DUF2085 domain-containing protein [Chloroflexota bacterium]NOH12813.1 DUF2085 domain-containing protein [Chloroflexota bacterium]
MMLVTLYSRQNCELCDEAQADLEALQKEIPHKLVLVDVDKDPALKEAYGEKVPVVETGPYTLEAPFDAVKLKMTLGAARDRNEQLADDKQHQKKVARGQKKSAADRISLWFADHYLALLNSLILLYVGLPFLAPVLMNAGLDGAARPIYAVYGAVCHQLGYRSWFLFGDQAAYPREAAGVDGLETFGAVTGISEGGGGAELLEARRFIGNEQVGYKVAYCERDVAIYAAMLLFGLIYLVTNRRIPSLPWYIWIVIGIAPIGIDGFSQLFSQIPSWPLWEYRESTPLLRTLTGGLFGFTTAWFGFPLVKETAEDARLLVTRKLARLQQEGTD